MKITIDVEATPQEMREFFGLPNLQPLQDDILNAIRDNMKQGVTGFDPMTLMKPLFPAQMQSMEMLQKTFWDAFTKASQAPRQQEETAAGNDNKKK
jgi:hypothetical protein